MTKEIHKRHLRAYKEQYWYAENFLEEFLELSENTNLNILEIGTAEAGLLKYFAEKGYKCYGIEYSEGRFNNSLILDENKRLNLKRGDVCDLSTFAEFNDIKFDVIVLRDVIEHVVEQEKALANIYSLLKPGGKFFISFPGKHSPFAGHQQVFPSVISKTPYMHLLPNFLYGKIMSLIGLNQASIEYYFFVKKNRLSINQFYKFCEKLNFKIAKEDYYFSRPNFEFRYKIKRRKNSLSGIKCFREVLSLGAVYILSK
ncbi:MAG: class I SAM-dependent methyltransferase [Melioribacteraceae bacterium]|nr:class I SAM-dependent methyltransferase [Melioribacteraceae bacterium]